MDSLRIGNGSKRILINDGPAFIEFNPRDVGFAERFYGVIKEFEAKQAEYQQRAEVIDRETSVDDNGLPINLEARLEFLRDVCEFMRGKIDHLFGRGTSQNIFGDALSLEMIGEFLEGITPFVQTARAEKVAQYSPRKTGRVMR